MPQLHYEQFYRLDFAWSKLEYVYVPWLDLGGVQTYFTSYYLFSDVQFRLEQFGVRLHARLGLVKVPQTLRTLTTNKHLHFSTIFPS